jgi:peptidoglycan-associated lipoprotein
MEESNKTVRFELVSNEGKKLNNGRIDVKDMTTGEIRQATIDANNELSMRLSENSTYEITATQKEYKTKTQMLTQEGIGSLDADMPLVITLSPATALFESNAVGETIELEIKYDVSKATIRKDAAKELDKLVEFMKRNPSVKVELGSHTDSRGSNEANLRLSQKRAESAVRYLAAKGVTTNRLIPIGYGEDALKVTNATTEEEHQHNRRTTIKIVGI